MCEEGDFAYFVDLYGAKAKFKIFQDTIQKYGSDGFIQYYQEVLTNVSKFALQN